MNRLKLFDDSIYTYLEHRDKVKFRKIAFKNKKTVSEFNRYLIQLIIKLDELNILNSKIELNENSINQIINSLGGTMNK